MDALKANGDFGKPPHRYELIDKDGEVFVDRTLDGYALRVPQFASAVEAAAYAKRLWPDQEQDPDRTGKGWDIQVVR